MVASRHDVESLLQEHPTIRPEVRLLAETVRESRITVLYRPAGGGRTALLHSGLLPWLRGSSPALGNTREIVVVFDAWAEAPLAALRDWIQWSLAAAFGEGAAELPAESSLARDLNTWCERLDVKLLIIFDRFEQYLTAPPERAGYTEFAEEWIDAVNLPGLAVNFLIVMDEDAEPQLARFNGPIPGLYDNCLRLAVSSPPPVRIVTPEPQGRSGQIREVLPEHEPSGPAAAEAGRALPQSRALESADSAPGPNRAADGKDPAVPAHRQPDQRPAPRDRRWRGPSAKAAAGLLSLLTVGLALATLLWKTPGQDQTGMTGPGALFAETAPVRSAAPSEASRQIKDEPPPLEIVISTGRSTEASAPAVQPPPRSAPVEPPEARVVLRPVSQPQSPTAAAKPFTPPGPAASAGASQAAPQIFIHIRNESQRPAAEQLGKLLQNQGIAVSGIKRVERGPARADLRYFRADERDEAWRVRDLLLDADVPVAQVKRISGYELSAAPRRYELWLPAGWLPQPAYR